MPQLRFLIAFALCCAGLVRAADTKDTKTDAKSDKPPKSFVEQLQEAGVKTQAGPATVKLGDTAELKLPAGSYFVGPDSLDRFYQLTQNFRGKESVGVMLAPQYTLFFSYEDSGYVKDDEKLDAPKLLETMTEGVDASNEERRHRGWDEMKLKGWATPPYYDGKTHNLKWAINLTSSQDGHKEVFINESIRILGRGGVMKITLSTDTPSFKAAEADTDKLLASNFSYISGQKYSEFKAGDKVAAYGLSALVLGGAGVMAAKMGLFSKLGVLLAKAWKAIVFALVAVGAAIKKFFNKITGARPEEPQQPQQPPAA
jgi:uncharacterized membrane-anchored protein